MKTNIFLAILLIAALLSMAFSVNEGQESQKPTPTVGWDSFRANIQYPEILRRAGVEGIAVVTGTVDETGSVNELTVLANHEGFSNRVEKATRSAKWTPAKVNGKQVKASLVFSVHFVIVGEGAPKSLTVQTQADQ